MFGSKAIESGYNYWGSLAVAVCVRTDPSGDLYLTRIWNGDTRVWPVVAGGAAINASSADGDGKTTLTTTIGTIDFYWGTATQNPNDLLESLEIDYGSGAVAVPMPAFRNLCYAVLRDCAFGSQVTPPSLRFEIFQAASQLVLGGAEAHATTDGAVLVPEAIYTVLTNTLWGFAVDPVWIDSAIFNAANEVAFQENLYARISIDSNMQGRELLTQLLSYIDGHLVFDGGKLQLKLIRDEDTSDVPVLSEADLLDEPEITDEQYDTTWNQTRVTYTKRPDSLDDPAWEDAVEPWDDEANAAIQQRYVPQDYNFPWCGGAPQAQAIARRLGIKGGVPARTWTIEVKPKWRTIKPTALIAVSFAKYGATERILRVTEVTVGDATKPSVRIVGIEESARASTLYTPTDVNPVKATVAPVSTTLRLSTVPSALKGGHPDGFLAAMQRPDAYTIGGSLWFTYDPLTQSYIRCDETISGFPAKGQLIAWHKLANGNWTFRVQMNSALDAAWFLSLTSEALEISCVVGQRRYKTVGTPKNQHQVLAPWLLIPSGARLVALGSNTFDVEMTGGGYGSPDLALEQLAVDGVYPTLHCYFGRVEDFYIFTMDSVGFELDRPFNSRDTTYIRYLKATMRNYQSEQALVDGDGMTYARHDTTMCPDGTYSRDWGTRTPTTYELFDLSALNDSLLTGITAEADAALMAMFLGTATADQIAMFSTLNDVMGAVIRDHSFYNSP